VAKAVVVACARACVGRAFARDFAHERGKVGLPGRDPECAEADFRIVLFERSPPTSPAHTVDARETRRGKILARSTQ
jgi:hypothetical protein